MHFAVRVGLKSLKRSRANRTNGFDAYAKTWNWPPMFEIEAQYLFKVNNLISARGCYQAVVMVEPEHGMTHQIGKLLANIERVA